MNKPHQLFREIGKRKTSVLISHPWHPISWHDTSKQIAGIAQRAGYHIRPKPGWNQWQVWATDADFEAIKQQAIPTT